MGRKPKSEKIILETIGIDSLTFTEIVKRTGLPRATVSHALKRLQKKELVMGLVKNGKVRWEITPKAATILMGSKSKLTREVLESLVSRLGGKELTQWSKQDWAFLFEKMKLLPFFKEEPELNKKFEKMKKEIIEVWPEMRKEISLRFAVISASALIALEGLESVEDKKKYLDNYAVNAITTISTPIVYHFIRILQKIIGVTPNASSSS